MNRKTADSVAFGPIPSRRFGCSLGVNNVPRKTCSYSCVYCQVGWTDAWRCRRGRFRAPRELAALVGRKIRAVEEAGGRVDFVTFVSEGEPTLDAGLGVEIGLLKRLSYPVAVITNGSILHRADVRRDLGQADRVSVKVDAVREDLWRALDRPHKALRFAAVIDGVREFARSYRGRLLTETMLVAGVNDSPAVMREVGGFVAGGRISVAEHMGERFYRKASRRRTGTP